MNAAAYLPQSKRLLEQVSEVLRYKHYSLKTEQAYLYWVRFTGFAFSCAGMGVTGKCSTLAAWAGLR